MLLVKVIFIVVTSKIFVKLKPINITFIKIIKPNLKSIQPLNAYKIVE